MSVSSIDWSKFALKRAHVLAVAAILFFTSLGVVIVQFAQSREGVLPAGGTVGGDYVAFFAAAKSAAAGETEAPYDATKFEALLKAHGPDRERYGLTWQYPPTYYFLILPLAFLSYFGGYALWSAATAGAFFALLARARLSPLFMFVILSAPSTTHGFITGQNGFLTAALIGLAALFAKERPLLAGLCAAVLTVKPQLGVLLPIAFIAGGCWRAFMVAVAGAVALALASVAAFGLATWTSFLEGGRFAADNLTAGLLPLFKMATPFSAARLAGLGVDSSAVIAFAIAGLAACAVALVWRRVEDDELRAAALISSAFLATPYGYYYELVILALPVALIARRAMERGFLPFEQPMLALAYITPLFLPGEPKKSGLSLGLFIVLLILALVFRRIAHERPAAFRFASAASPATAGS